MKKVAIQKWIWVVAGLCCLSPWVTSGGALILGIALALMLGNPFSGLTKKWSSRLLQISVVGLGAGMNLGAIAQAGETGILYTLVGITATLALGMWLGVRFRTSRDLSLLLACGTAICGGSAIAAAASTIDADDRDISVSLVTVFFLNAVALFLFPAIGRLLGMGEIQFGFWSALAIHDTSSVVGASLQYGPKALEVATIVKLARALWIIPVTLVISFVYRRDGPRAKKMKWPWFILGFVGMAALVSFFPSFRPVGREIQEIAKRSLVLTLFLIGANMPRGILNSPEIRRAFAQGLVLWAIVATSTLGAIYFGWII